MNPLYSTAAASPIICRRIAAKAVSATSTTSTVSSTTSLIKTPQNMQVRHAGNLTKIAQKAQEIQAAKAAVLAASSSTTGGTRNTLNGPGTPGSADRLMAKIIESRGGEANISPAEKQKLELRLMKMKMSRKQFMKWLKAHPQNPITIPNTKLVMPEGHGENIWLWHHTEAGHVVYSLHPQMDSNKALAQFPYTGKKLVPPKLRRDYWRPFLQIQFPQGKGEIGRSVWQKLVELKKRHELEWTKDAETREDYYRMSREDRGRAINDQRANVIADIAAVLGGLGKGNKILLELSKNEKKRVNAGEEVERKLCGVKVFWGNGRDRFFAESWSGNVAHFLGLPGRDGKGGVALDVETEVEVVEEKEKKEGEAEAGGEEVKAEGEVKEGDVKEVEGKKEGEASSAKL